MRCGAAAGTSLPMPCTEGGLCGYEALDFEEVKFLRSVTNVRDCIWDLANSDDHLRAVAFGPAVTGSHHSNRTAAFLRKTLGLANGGDVAGNTHRG